jgi:hypothetical protein
MVEDTIGLGSATNLVLSQRVKVIAWLRGDS